MVRLLANRHWVVCLVGAACLLVAETAGAQHQLPGFSAPRVRARNPQAAMRPDPAPAPRTSAERNLPPAYAQRPAPRMTPAPGHVALQPVPGGHGPAPRGPASPGVRPVAHQTIDRSGYESEIFFDDPAPGEELPPPAGAPQGGPYDPGMPDGGYYDGPVGYPNTYDYGGPTSDGCCAPGHSCGGHFHAGFQVGPFHSALENFSVFAGMQGFESPVDLGLNGNFGFHEGLNYGGCVASFWDLGYQIGGQAVQSDLSGFTTGGDFSEDARHQYFVTAGIFRRYRNPIGFQWGVVYDYLHDDYDINMDLGQVRGEISYRGWHCNEIGFWFTSNVTEDTQPVFNDTGTTILFTEEWTTTDLYALFWRRQFCNGATARIWGGGTGDSDGLFGAEFEMPLSPSFAVSTIANYKIPEEGASVAGTQNEAWGIGLSLVWYPCRTAQNNCSPFRPLFNVANNATMMSDRAALPVQ